MTWQVADRNFKIKQCFIVEMVAFDISSLAFQFLENLIGALLIEPLKLVIRYETTILKRFEVLNFLLCLKPPLLVPRRYHDKSEHK